MPPGPYINNSSQPPSQRKSPPGENHNLETYFELFSYSKITLNQTYPTSFEMVLYDQEPPEWNQKKPTFFVVALRDETKGPRHYGYGHVTVEVYS